MGMTQTTATTTHEARLQKHGKGDAAYFRGACTCGWHAVAWNSNRTVEGRRLAARDARDHVAAATRARCTVEGAAGVCGRSSIGTGDNGAPMCGPHLRTEAQRALNA